MYGVPKQTIAEVENDLKTAMTFQPQHMSVYQLTVEPGTPMEKARLPGESVVLKQLKLVRRMLKSGGWEPYEISNFAKEHCMCQHNLHYWRYGEYLGLGSGATSFIVRPAGTTARSSYGVRWTMTRDIKRYLKGRFEFEESDHVALRTAMGEFCFLGLRTSEGISFDAFERRFGRTFKHAFPGVVEDLSRKKLVAVDGDVVVLTQKGVELSNVVFERFVE
jgi:oxygen-independent coproporphyrinogen-3 oxidase